MMHHNPPWQHLVQDHEVNLLDGWSGGGLLVADPEYYENLSEPVPWTSSYRTHRPELWPVLRRVSTVDGRYLRAMLQGEGQVAQAKRFGISQSAVCTATAYAIYRARIVAEVFALVPSQQEQPAALIKVCIEAGVSPFDAWITACYFWLPNQSAVAKLLGKTQGFIYYRLTETIKHIHDQPLGIALTLLGDATSTWRGETHLAGSKAKAWLLDHNPKES